MSAFTRSLLPASRAAGRGKVLRLYVLLAVINVAVWAWAAVSLRHSAALLGTAFLAYSFGLRHAMDADHIAAIDNVTRKLMNDGQRPVGVGFFFALGHSAVVIVGAIGIALATRAVDHHVESLRATGAVIGTLVSAGFLLVIGLINVVLLVDIYRAFRRVRNGLPLSMDHARHEHVHGNLLGRLFRPLFGLVRSSWLMFPLGFLFGLGFETATEIALLGTAAAQASVGLPIWTILLFPCLFTAGMLTVDSTDGVLMLGAYGWALIHPLRKLYYNLTITLVSTLVALLIGGIEALGLLGQALSLTSPFWRFIDALNDNFGTLGYVIIGVFVVGWLISVGVYRLRGYDRESLAN
jgi:high-affinity nickel-transport protein